MDSTTRCRHRSVSWLNSHTCQCDLCGKQGHWFENPELVMWHRSTNSESESGPAILPTAELPTFPTTVNNAASNLRLVAPDVKAG